MLIQANRFLNPSFKIILATLILFSVTVVLFPTSSYAETTYNYVIDVCAYDHNIKSPVIRVVSDVDHKSFKLGNRLDANTCQTTSTTIQAIDPDTVKAYLRNFGGKAGYVNTIELTTDSDVIQPSVANMSETIPRDTSESAESFGTHGIIVDTNSTTFISINDINALEGNSNSTDFVFTVTRSNNVDAISVDYFTANGTASSSTDYAQVPLGTINFVPGGLLTKTVAISINGDVTLEPNETFYVNLSTCVGCIISDSQGIGTITNDDLPPDPIIFSDTFQSGFTKWTETGEGDWTLEAPTEKQVPNHTSNLVAHSDNCDFTCTITKSTPIDLRSQSSATLTFWRYVDNDLDSGEYLKVELYDGTNWNTVFNWTNNAGDDDTWHKETVNLGNYLGASNFNLRFVTHESAAAEDVQIDDVQIDNSFTPTIPITNASPSAGSFSTAQIVTLTTNIPATIYYTTDGTIPTQSSPVYSEPISISATTTLKFFAKDSTGTTESVKSLVYTINTSPTTQNISINDVTLAEGNSGTKNFAFTVTRSVNTGAASVQYATASNSATSPSDYAAIPLSTIAFTSGGSLTQTVNVSVIGDTAVEPNETFFVNLSNCVGCTITDNQGTGTITNDDSSTPTISINDVTLTEGNSGTKNFVFTVTRSNNVGAISVNYITADNTAISPTDYVAKSSTTLNFAAGGPLTQTVTISVNGDTTVESSESFFVNLSNCVGCTISDSQGTGTITNDDSTGATHVQIAGWRSSEYGNDNPYGHDQSDPNYWIGVAQQMSSKFPGSSPGGVLVVGELDGAPGTTSSTFLPFPKPAGTYPNVNFGTTDAIEPLLNAYDNAGLKLYLQVESADADIPMLMDLIMNRYKQHPSVIGFGVDVEWYHQKQFPDGRPLTDAELTAWASKVLTYNPNYTLMVKHWDWSYLSNARPSNVLFLTDSEQIGSLSAAISEYTAWVDHFGTSQVGFQIGYPSDMSWWSNLSDPASAIVNPVIAARPNANIGVVYWVDFSVLRAFPPS